MQLLSTATLFFLSLASSQSFHGPEDSRLVDRITLDVPTNGVSTTPDGRVFLVISHADGNKGPSVVEYNTTTKTSTAYPNAEWNNYTTGVDPATHFVNINSQRIGPDGNLYIVDTGSGFLSPVIAPTAPKLVQVNITTNQVSRIYYLGNATRSSSFVDDVRFNPSTGFAYLTDAGVGASGLIVLHMASGGTRRVLDGDLSTSEYMPISAEGSILYFMGKPAYIYADQLEVSPDGRYFYYQPSSGGLSRIETKYLNEAFYNSSLNFNAVLDKYVEPFAHTPSTGGTAIDAKGNVYVSDTDSQRIIRVAPNGTQTLLVQDPRLLWVDAMWVDSQGCLWMPAAQLNRGMMFNNGTSKIVKPLHVYTLDIGIGPSPIDHK